ncbi:hypothetical protein HY250_03420 [Candidatus Azambacteria bacterium]|nr:hypothetical protein [Candidatus Azambacteria bacterium]MBI3685427.1 hypothetical protein [Candidatus Azambacteria bacterium]
MGIEEPKQYTPEEMAAMEKSRRISDAELLKDGAEYVVDERGKKRLELESDEKIREIRSREFGERIHQEAEISQRDAAIYVLEDIEGFFRKSPLPLIEFYVDGIGYVGLGSLPKDEYPKEWRNFMKELYPKIIEEAKKNERKDILEYVVEGKENFLNCPVCLVNVLRAAGSKDFVI